MAFCTSNLSKGTSMAWRTITCDSISETCTRLHAMALRDTLAFRGESRYNDTIFPSIDRVISTDASYLRRLSLERDAINEFTIFAKAMLPWHQAECLHRDFDRLTLMQHYRAPTRLVDWTNSPWVAAFFACASDPGEDGIVRVFDQTPLYEKFKPEYGDIATTLQFGSDLDVGKLLFRHPSLNWIATVTPPVTDQRMLAQQAFFSIAGTLATDHGVLLDSAIEDSSDEFSKVLVRIPALMKPDMLKQLHRTNITAATLFPGMDGIGWHIEQTIKIRPLDARTSAIDSLDGPRIYLGQETMRRIAATRGGGRVFKRMYSQNRIDHPPTAAEAPPAHPVQE
ncbi:MAG: FRG domain-containing protein [Phycisphaeraceae bacterium]|nr:FRG domain-containing protein [Phycisphaeraceae bacterium]